MKRRIPFTLTVLLSATLTTMHAVEPPVSPPERLPTSPADLAELLARTDAVDARVKERQFPAKGST